MKLARLFVFLFVFSLSFLSLAPALAQTTGGTVTCPSGTTLKGGVCFPTDTGLSQASVSDIIKNLMYWLLAIFGFLAVIAFVISGIQYLTAAGNEKQVDTAKKNMQYSIIGVIVALSGLVLVTAISEALTAGNTAF